MPCRLALQNPNFRTDSELQDIRSFKTAAYEMLDRKDRLVRAVCMAISQLLSVCPSPQCLSTMLQVAFDLRLARFYMWAQTDDNVYIAVRVPTGIDLPD